MWFMVGGGVGSDQRCSSETQADEGADFLKQLVFMPKIKERLWGLASAIRCSGLEVTRHFCSQHIGWNSTFHGEQEE